MTSDSESINLLEHENSENFKLNDFGGCVDNGDCSNYQRCISNRCEHK